jgi:hypothetical protein
MILSKIKLEQRKMHDVFFDLQAWGTLLIQAQVEILSEEIDNFSLSLRDQDFADPDLGPAYRKTFGRIEVTVSILEQLVFAMDDTLGRLEVEARNPCKNHAEKCDPIS